MSFEQHRRVARGSDAAEREHSRPDLTTDDRIAVLGAGLMGSQIGIEFALHGFHVHFLEADGARAQGRIRETFERVRELNLADADAVDAAGRSITVVRDVDELPVSLRLVVECLPEDLDLKVRILRAVSVHADEAVLASNTSSLSIAALGQGVGTPERTVGMHYWNPPLLMPLVEVTSGPDTGSAAVELVTRAVEVVGKVAVLVQRDVPGFIWNRLQMAVLREALWLLDNDVATVDTIDKVAQLGLARRWRQTGLFGSIALGGGSIWETVAANLFPQLSCASDASGLARRMREEEARWNDLEHRRDEGLAHDPVE